MLIDVGEEYIRAPSSRLWPGHRAGKKGAGSKTRIPIPLTRSEGLPCEDLVAADKKEVLGFFFGET